MSSEVCSRFVVCITFKLEPGLTLYLPLSDRIEPRMTANRKNNGVGMLSIESEVELALWRAGVDFLFVSTVDQRILSPQFCPTPNSPILQ